MITNQLNEELFQLCDEETQKFLRGLQNISDYCYELFRRSFAEKNDEAFAYLVRAYHSLVLGWLKRHSQSFVLDLPLEDHVNSCNGDFHKGMQNKPFSRFPNIQAILQYWKVCTHNFVNSAARQKKLHEVQLEANQVTTNTDMRQPIDHQWLWERINELAAEPNLQLLARLVLEQSLSPREIAQYYPAQWATPGDVRPDRQTLMRRLRKDPELRNFFEVKTS